MSIIHEHLALVNATHTGRYRIPQIWYLYYVLHILESRNSSHSNNLLKRLCLTQHGQMHNTQSYLIGNYYWCRVLQVDGYTAVYFSKQPHCHPTLTIFPVFVLLTSRVIRPGDDPTTLPYVNTLQLQVHFVEALTWTIMVVCATTTKHY